MTTILSSLAAIVLFVGTAGAAEHEAHHAPSITDLFFPAVNFVLFIFLIRWAAGGAIRSYLTERREEIMGALENASSAREQATRTYADAKALLAQIDEHAASHRDEMIRLARTELNRRIELATQLAKRIGEEARLVADQEERHARAALQEETVRAAISETLALLRRQIKSADQDRFMDDFAAEVRARP